MCKVNRLVHSFLVSEVHDQIVCLFDNILIGSKPLLSFDFNKNKKKCLETMYKFLFPTSLPRILTNPNPMMKRIQVLQTCLDIKARTTENWKYGWEGEWERGGRSRTHDKGKVDDAIVWPSRVLSDILPSSYPGTKGCTFSSQKLCETSFQTDLLHLTELMSHYL